MQLRQVLVSDQAGRDVPAGEVLAHSGQEEQRGERQGPQEWFTGQTIVVTEGLGRAQRRGGRIEVIPPGDRVFFEPREEHCPGAAPNQFMTHLATLEVDDRGS